MLLQATGTDLDVMTILVGLLGGLALFLFGMEQMTDALKAVAGGGMRKTLNRLATNRFTAALSGAFVTSVIQSSSVTTVLVVGFVSASLMTLSQSIGIIMGANVGTTITAQIIAFKVTKYALVLVAVGFGLMFTQKRDRTQRYGAMIMGLGLIFFGMSLMSDATSPLRDYQPFIDAMESMRNPLWAILGGAVFTAVVQSSSATTGIVIVLAGQGFITLEAGIALTLGANVGTCATALLAALGKPRVAVQAAAVHVVFNVFGALLWVGLIGSLADVVRQISPASPELAGAARLAAETPRQIANAHTLFNVANVALFIWFTGPLAKLISRILPVPPEVFSIVSKPKYLDDVYLKTPALAVDRVRMEMGHLGGLVVETFNATEVPETGERVTLVRITRGTEDVDAVYHCIVDYARRILAADLPPRETKLLEGMLGAANNLQAIGETIQLNIGTVARQWRQEGLAASEQTRSMFAGLHESVRHSVERAATAVEQEDQDLAVEVIEMKRDINEQADELTTRLGERLTAEGPGRVSVYRLEMDVIEALMRVYYLAKRVAKTVADQAPSTTTHHGTKVQ
jgi:phosphate:Na+ symporter